MLFGGRARFTTSNPSSHEKSGLILRQQTTTAFPELANVRIRLLLAPPPA